MKLEMPEPNRVCLLVILPVSLLLLTVLSLSARTVREEQWPAAPLPLRLVVDKDRHGRAFYGGLPIMVSLAGTFDITEPVLPGKKRTSIFSGFWNGEVRQNLPGSHQLSGRHPASGAAYTVKIRQVDSARLELDFGFTAPSRPADLEFDFLKLAGDLFAGAGLESAPAAITDAAEIPGSPSPVARRIKLAGKNRVRVRGALCDLEITDQLGASSIQVADFRAVPWDKEKSILISVARMSLVPGRHYQFSYSVRCMPPSRTALIRSDRAVGTPLPGQAGRTGMTAPPKEVQQAPGYCLLSGMVPIYGRPNGSAERMLAMELQRLTHMPTEIVLPAHRSRTGIRMEVLSGEARRRLPAEGYELSVNRDGAVIRGADFRGCLYGAYALLNRLQRIQGEWRIPAGIIRDWPDLALRGVCIAMSAPPQRDPALIKRYLEAISRAGGNLVIFLHEPLQVAEWRKNGRSKGWTQEQLAEIAAYARFLQMDVWAGMGSAFSATDFPGLPVAQGTNFYNPFEEKAYHLLYGLYDQLLKVYQPGTLLISHDEIRGLSVYASAAKVGEAEIFARDVTGIRNWLAGKGIATALWGDMLLDHHSWEGKVGAANGSNPFFNSGPTHLALEKLPKDVVILDWHYDLRNEYRSIEHFRSRGFQVLGAPWHDPHAARSMAGSVKQFKGQGIVATDWGLVSTLSPAATTLMAPLCGWSSRCSAEDNGDVEFLAGMLRDRETDISSHAHSPLPLGEATNRSTKDEQPGSGRGIFDLGPLLDLRGLLPGRQSFGGITFDIVPPPTGKQGNCIVVTGNGYDPAGSAVITLPPDAAPVNAIAFLHTGFVPEPGIFPREVGEYLVEFHNGRKSRIALQENWNITDVRSTTSLRVNPWTFSRSPEVLAGSTTGWRGSSAAGIPLNLQVLVWRNPSPGERIRRITVKSSNTVPGSSLALLGVTLLR